MIVHCFYGGGKFCLHRGGYHSGMATIQPQDDFQKTALRLPRDLHAQLHEAAAAAGRSYNAEIVARLQASFEPLGPQHSVKADDGHTVYLLLDTNGYPISWDEVRELYGPLIDGQPVRTLQVSVITPDIASSSGREAQVRQLAKMLRAGGKSTVIPRKSKS